MRTTQGIVRRCREAFGLLLLLAAVHSVQGQELLINGGFDDPISLSNQTIIQNQGYLTISPTDSTTINGWTVVPNTTPLVGPISNLDLVNSQFLVQSSPYAIDLVGTSAGSTLGAIQQSVTLSAGTFYQLSFSIAHYVNVDPAGLNYISATITNTLSGTLTQSFTLPTAALTWTRVTIGFIAAGGSSTIQFDALRELASDSGAYLDDVSLTVPEASTLWVAAALTAFVGYIGWRRLRPSRTGGAA